MQYKSKYNVWWELTASSPNEIPFPTPALGFWTLVPPGPVRCCRKRSALIMWLFWCIWYIRSVYKVSLDDSFTLSSGHSCREVAGLVRDRISTHQLSNRVQIAALIPRLGPAGGPWALGQPMGIVCQQTSSLMDLELTAASPLRVQHSCGTYRPFSTLYI